MKPIPVEMVRFDGRGRGGQDGPGLSQASAVRSKSAAEAKNQPYHEVEYLPDLQHFRVVHHGRDGAIRVGMIHVGRASYWVPAENPAEADARAAKK